MRYTQGQNGENLLSRSMYYTRYADTTQDSVFVRMYVCTYVCLYVCMYVRMYHSKENTHLSISPHNASISLDIAKWCLAFWHLVR